MPRHCGGWKKQRVVNSMENYMEFAAIYDTLMHDDIDYGAMADYIQNIFERQGVSPGLVLDLACGTGSLTSVLAQRGYDMIGVDLSDAMLNVARTKGCNLGGEAGEEEQNSSGEGACANGAGEILYLCQDMREFELYGTVDAIVCMTDSMNYITETDDLLQVFKLAKNYLNPGAPLIFDINSAHKIRDILGCNTFTHDDEGVFYVWENEYDEAERLCDFYLTFFVKDGKRYRRFDEMHTERAYEIDEITEYLKQAGFEHIDIYDAYTFEPPKHDSERIVFSAV